LISVLPLLALPCEGLAGAQQFLQMPFAEPRLPRVRQGPWRADLTRDRRGHLVITLEIRSEDAADQRDAFGGLRLRKRCECASRGGDRTFDVVRITERDFGKGFFRAGIDHRQTCVAGRLDPRAVDIKLQCIGHAVFRWKGVRHVPSTSAG
jgi:hypothetical protein